MSLGPFGTTELLLILVIVVVVFGATKLPRLGERLGPSIERWRRAQMQVAWLQRRSPQTPRPWTFADWSLILVPAILMVAVIANALAQAAR